MIVKTDSNGNVIAAKGNMGEIQTAMAWILCQMKLVYGQESGRVIAEAIPMGEALDMWSRATVAEA